MLAGLSKVVQNLIVVAPGVLKGVGQDGKAVEGFLVVGALGEGENG
jgi:hypothetical protein